MTHKKNITKFVHMGLVAICVGLGVVLFMELNTDYAHNESITINETDITEEVSFSDVIEELPPLSDYQTTVDRPLFMQDRQPYVYEPPKEEKITETRVKKETIEKKPPQQLVLTATIITPDRRAAIIQTAKSKEPLHVAIGETIDNRTLEEVHAQYIVLKEGEKTEKLELEIQSSPRTPHQSTRKELSQRAKRQTAEIRDSKKIDTEKDTKNPPVPAEAEPTEAEI